MTDIIEIDTGPVTVLEAAIQGPPGVNGTDGTNGAQGPAGPAPSGTGVVYVIGGVAHATEPGADDQVLGHVAGVPAWIPPPAQPTTAKVLGGATYDVADTDVLVVVDSSNGLRATVRLPATPSVRTLRVVWWKWSLGAPGPLIDGNGKTMTPYAQDDQTSGALVATTAITDFGASYSITWDGQEWIGS